MSNKLFLCIICMAVILIAGAYALFISQAPSASVMAECVRNDISKETAYRFGETVSQYETPTIMRLAAVRCEGGIRLVSSTKLREDVSSALIPLLLANSSFREGIYAGTAASALNAGQRARVGKLGLTLEDHARVQRQAVSCLEAEPEAVAFVGQLDLPFAVAVIGIQVNIGDIQIAQGLADILLTKAQKIQAQLPLQECNVTSKQEFLAYANQMQQFAAGKHPWAPGCGITSTSSDLKLVCKGTGK
ncbi:MAG: hypothetical protein Q7S87_09010 [Agitococcus sp.]|nr:hypothetical protein [Agitococcus sp.]MDO9177040.1 hypothetical protein [Agitococcus sp.]